MDLHWRCTLWEVCRLQQVIVQIITALFGSLGFALMFNLGKRNVIPAAIMVCAHGSYIFLFEMS